MLGANDGIVSTASLMVGVASASRDPAEVLVAGIAGLAAGALSMAAGEYVSVHSQRDAELADVRLEKQAQEQNPEAELDELTHLYVQRGLDPGLAREVARQFHAHDALEAHLREELRLDPEELAKPVQAAVVSALSFSVGAAVPIVASVLVPPSLATWVIIGSSTLCLAGTGALGAYLGGAPMGRATVRVVVGGLAAMAITGLIGRLVGIAV